MILHKKTKLIIIGASYLQVPLIYKAADLGIETHVFAWKEGSVGKDICDYFYPISIVEKEKILEVARRINADGVISIGSDLAMITVNYLAEELSLIGNSMPVTHRTTNKYLMRKMLSSAGLPCPKFYNISEDTRKEIGKFSYPVIVKPTDRSGSRGVTKVLHPNDLSAAVDRALSESFSKEALIEEFVSGNEISVEMISFQGVHYPLAITDKVTTGPPFFVELAHHQPAAIPDNRCNEIYTVVQNALDALGVEYGASHSELLLTPDEKNIFVEIGARMGGDCIGSDLVELSTGYDFVKGVIDVALNRFTEVEKPISKCSGICYIRHNPGKVVHVEDRTETVPQIVRKEINVKPGDQLKPLMESANRTGYYIYCDSRRFIPDIELIQIKTEQVNPTNKS